MTEPREVCKICFGSTSHKPNPTLTSESKVTYDSSSKKKKCGVCRQEWAPIRVTKEVGSGVTKWVRIRPRPKIPANIDFQICKNMQQGKGECMKGQDCSYAHSKAELLLWNQEREKEPRPAPSINGPYQYQLCKHMLSTGTCPYGQRCTFAHSDEELQSWLQVQAGVQLQENAGFPQGIRPTPSSVEFRCDICNLNCTSRKQLDDHISGTKHKQQVAAKALHDYQNPTPAQSMGRRGGNLRRRPLLSFPINGYKLCLHTQAGRRCIYGEYCTFAHSQIELEEWNRQLQFVNARVGGGIARFQASAFPGQQAAVNLNPVPVPMAMTSTSVAGVPPVHPGGSSGPSEAKPDVMSVSGLDDFDDELSPECQDFAFTMRSKIATQQKQKREIQGFEKTRENVTITEVSGTALELMWNKPSNVQWQFEISVTAPRMLHSLVLFDMLAVDFSIEGVWLISYGGQQKPLDGAKAIQGVGVQLNQRIVPPDRIHVKISLKPRSGILGQLVVFDFGAFHLVRGVCVHVLKEHEARLLQNAGTPRQRKPEKPDLYWEQRYSQIPMESSHSEETDRSLPDYPLPEQVERLIDAGKYNNVENRVTKDNYKRRMHNLLYLEEYQQRVDMSRYDLYNIEIAPSKDYRTPQGVTYATEGIHFIKVAVDEVLFEGGRSLRPSDGALLLPMNQMVVHECSVEHVAREAVILKITEKARQASATSRNQVSIRFFLGRIQMKAMHYAVDQLYLEAIFPAISASNPTETPEEVKRCLEELKGLELNTTQKQSINCMLDPACRPIPSLVLGPFGCGKTRTLGECGKLLVLHQKNARILICTHSNSAANLYVENMDQEWRRRFDKKAPLFRLYYIGRRLNTVPFAIQQYCKIERGQLTAPLQEELRQYRIVVATLQTSRVLSLMGLPKGYFSHILIDEAAQALEAETLVPLSLANEHTKIILAGDHMQMDPPVYSDIAKKYGLQISLLERLYDHEAYNNGVGQLCKTLLTENHRSHQQILELPSKLFYKNKLSCKALFPSTGPKDIPALTFIGVDGQESQEEDSPSYYNDHEAMKIAEQVQLLVSKGLQEDQVCVLAYYFKQVQRIRYILRQQRLGQVVVCRVDDIQGREYRALLVSTVRTCFSDPIEEEVGFLNNPKLFNTAVTRAREWLVVVGEPITLCTVGSNRLCWLEFIKKSKELGSFDYPNAEHFESFLETRLLARQILEKSSGSFLKKTQSSRQPSQPAKVPSTTSHPPSDPHPHPPSHHPSHTSAANPQPPTATTTVSSASFMQANPQVRQQILRTKIHQVAQSGDDVTINRIIGEILKLSTEQQALWLSKPDFFTYKVREMEQVLRRAGPTAAVMSTARMPAPLLGQSSQMNPPGPPGMGYPGVNPNINPNMNPNVNPYPTGVNLTNQLGPVGSGLPPHSLAALTSDLPLFITRMIEALTMHAKFCDHQLQTCPHLPPEGRDNLLKQKTNLQQQMKLVNEQINLYREVVKIYKASQPQPSDPTPVPTSANIPSHMPSALPPTTPVSIPVIASRPPMPQGHLPRPMPGGMIRVAPPHPVHMMPGVRMPGMPIRPGMHFEQQMQPHPQPHLQPHPHQHLHLQSQPHPQINSAFTYGVSADVGNSQDLRFAQSQPQPPLSVQTNLASRAKPGGMGSGGKRRSPLGAAINSRSSPHSHPPVQDELYISDDELDL